jgi:hypothetical protein
MQEMLSPLQSIRASLLERQLLKRCKGWHCDTVTTNSQEESFSGKHPRDTQAHAFDNFCAQGEFKTVIFTIGDLVGSRNHLQTHPTNNQPG